MSVVQRLPIYIGIFACLWCFISNPVFAVDITVSNGQTATTTQSSTAIGDVITIQQAGNITVNGIPGVQAANVDVTVNNSGRINTTGANATGIDSTTNDVTINNNGTISTTGNNAFGINSTGPSATINNSGLISTTGDNAEGIYATGNDATIVNTGSITTAGDNADGLWADGGNNATIINSGTVTVTGDNGFGVAGTGANANIINTGSIMVTGGPGNAAVGLTGNNSVLTNSGLISATGPATVAIFTGGGGNQTLNLVDGSRIFGTIDLGGGTDVVNILGSFPSAQMTFAGVESIVVAPGVAAVTNGTTSVTTFDGTGAAVLSSSLASITGGIHQVVNHRINYIQPVKPIQVATNDLTAGMLFQEQAPVAWGEIFGATRERETHGNVQQHEHHYGGFAGGYEQDLHNARVGLLGGYARSSIETSLSSIDLQTDSFFVGSYVHIKFASIDITGTLIGGFEDHENNRVVFNNLTGIETANANFDSYFISPSLTFSKSVEVSGKVVIQPSATFAYNAGWYDDYTETGTTASNLTIDDRDSNVISTRLQLASIYRYNDSVNYGVRAGIKSRHIDDDDVEANLAGANFRFSAIGDDDVFGGFIGGNLQVAFQDSFSLDADIEYTGMAGDEDEIAASISLHYLF